MFPELMSWGNIDDQNSLRFQENTLYDLLYMKTKIGILQANTFNNKSYRQTPETVLIVFKTTSHKNI